MKILRFKIIVNKYECYSAVCVVGEELFSRACEYTNNIKSITFQEYRKQVKNHVNQRNHEASSTAPLNPLALAFYQNPPHAPFSFDTLCFLLFDFAPFFQGNALPKAIPANKSASLKPLLFTNDIKLLLPM